MEIPNPGSPEAQERECTCPVIDNNYGKGVNGQFWMNNECPLHGWDANSTKPFKLGTTANHGTTNDRRTTANRD